MPTATNHTYQNHSLLRRIAVTSHMDNIGMHASSPYANRLPDRIDCVYVFFFAIAISTVLLLDFITGYVCDPRAL